MTRHMSRRYGNLDKLGRKTDDRCHLCHDPVDLDCYGPTGLFGPDTVTVDHLTPQAFGGDDDDDNLLLAHGDCNSYRGTRDVEDVRLELAGASGAPLGRTEKSVLTLGVGAAAFAIGGNAFPRMDEQGLPRFNPQAGMVSALLAAALLQVALT